MITSSPPFVRYFQVSYFIWNQVLRAFIIDKSRQRQTIHFLLKPMYRYACIYGWANFLKLYPSILQTHLLEDRDQRLILSRKIRVTLRLPAILPRAPEQFNAQIARSWLIDLLLLMWETSSLNPLADKGVYRVGSQKTPHRRDPFVILPVLSIPFNLFLLAYQCTICLKRFKTISNLNRHIKTHGYDGGFEPANDGGSSNTGFPGKGGTIIRFP